MKTEKLWGVLREKVGVEVGKSASYFKDGKPQIVIQLSISSYNTTTVETLSIEVASKLVEQLTEVLKIAQSKEW